MKQFYFYIIMFFVGISSHAQVFLNEVYIVNSDSVFSEFEFIELINVGEEPVSIEGYSLCFFDENGVTQKKLLLTEELLKTKVLSSYETVYLSLTVRVLDSISTLVDWEMNRCTNIQLLDENEKTVDELVLPKLVPGRSVVRKSYEENTWQKSDKTYLFHFKQLTDTTKTNKTIIAEENTSSLKEKLKINEVFYIQDMTDILRKDFWVELMNVSFQEMELEELYLSTDTLYGKHKITNIQENVELPFLIPGEVLVVNLSSVYGLNTPYKADLGKHSSTLYLFHKHILIDSVTVPILDRDESYARLPDGYGSFTKVKYMTPKQPNKQLLPSKFTKPNYQILHFVGCSYSKYLLESQQLGTKYRPGMNLGFGFQKSLGLLELRTSMGFKTLGFRIKNESFRRANIYEYKTTTEGFQQMEYFMTGVELGLPVRKKWSVYYGMSFHARLNITSNIETETTVYLNTGEQLASTYNRRVVVFVPDNIDFMSSLAIEYQLIENLAFNLSYSRDFSGLNLEEAVINTNKVKTNLFELKVVVAFYKSKKLVPHRVLID